MLKGEWEKIPELARSVLPTDLTGSSATDAAERLWDEEEEEETDSEDDSDEKDSDEDSEEEEEEEERQAAHDRALFVFLASVMALSYLCTAKPDQAAETCEALLAIPRLYTTFPSTHAFVTVVMRMAGHMGEGDALYEEEEWAEGLKEYLEGIKAGGALFDLALIPPFYHLHVKRARCFLAQKHYETAFLECSVPEEVHYTTLGHCMQTEHLKVMVQVLDEQAEEKRDYDLAKKAGIVSKEIIFRKDAQLATKS